MGFKFELRLADGDDAGSLETSEANWQPRDSVIAHGNRRFRVVSVVPVRAGRGIRRRTGLRGARGRTALAEPAQACHGW
jgi:hypothetical protein